MSLENLGGPISGENMLPRKIEIKDGKEITLGFNDNRPGKEGKYYRLKENQEMVTIGDKTFIRTIEDVDSFMTKQDLE